MVMVENQISLAFHRPAGGEWSMVTSCNRDIVSSIIGLFSSHNNGDNNGTNHQ